MAEGWATPGDDGSRRASWQAEPPPQPLPQQPPQPERPSLTPQPPASPPPPTVAPQQPGYYTYGSSRPTGYNPPTYGGSRYGRHLAPAPPSGSNTAGTVLIAVVVLAIVVFIGVGAVVVTTDDDGSSAASGDETLGRRTPSTETDSTQVTTTTQVTPTTQPGGAPPAHEEVPAAEDLVLFQDTEAGYEMLVPGEWASTSLHGDLTGRGDELFPDDPAKAAELDLILTSLPRALIFMSVDPELLGTRSFVTNLNVVSIPEGRALDGAALERETILGLEAFGAEITSTEVYASQYGEAVKALYEIPSAGSSGLQYNFLQGGNFWSITLSAVDAHAHEVWGDEMADSFTVTP